MSVADEKKETDRIHPETDDEGIEKDSGDCDDDTRRIGDHQHLTLDRVLQVSTIVIR